jgi:hypothetical protein
MSTPFDRITGTTVAPSLLVDEPLLFEQSRVTSTWLGDYFGAVVHAGALYVAYPRNDQGLTHIYFAKELLP